MNYVMELCYPKVSKNMYINHVGFYIHYDCKNYNVILIIFFLLQEVGSIIGKKGEIVKRFREEVCKS